jgi:NarL family two-component system response regulator LiaR
MDLLMPGMDGLESTAAIIDQNPDAHILALTSSSDDEKVVAAVQAGVMGYLLKDARRVEILQGIRQVSQGKVYLTQPMASKLLIGMRQNRASPTVADPQEPEKMVETLTPRELDVLKLIGQGISNREIAQRLFLSAGTVRTHVHHILAKLGLKNRNQAILFALRSGLIHGPDELV